MTKINPDHQQQTDLIIDAMGADFSTMPNPFTWDQSVKFAHIIDGYGVAGGVKQCQEMSVSCEAGGVVNGRGTVGAGVAYLKLRELASTIKFHTISDISATSSRLWSIMWANNRRASQGYCSSGPPSSSSCSP